MKKIDLEKLIALHSQGMDDIEISKILNCSKHSVKEKRRILKLPNNDPGLKYWFLNEPYNSKIRSLYEKGYSDIKIVKRMRKDGIDIYLSNVTYWRTRNKLPERNSDILERTEIKGEDSLFCDTEFLERIFGKRLSKKECT